MNQTVLVVDDEERIRSSLKGILSDEGFRVLETGNAPAVMRIVSEEHPALVLLDIWMPEIDGIELLRQIKSASPEVEVIMLSGHGNIQTAVAATKLGAADFIEKPFSLDGLLGSISRVLERETGGTRPAAGPHPRSRNAPALPAGGIALPQRTVARSIVIPGQGLHTGLKTGVILHPAPAGTGIVFSSLADERTVAARLENVTDTGYNTTIAQGEHSIRTVEHLMSALHGFGITNLLVKTDGEVPAVDGSAVEFCKQIAEAGVSDQTPGIEPITIPKSMVLGQESEGEEYMRIERADRLIIDYALDYPPPIGAQRVHFELTSPEAYAREIAPARTFVSVREFRKLSEAGLGCGGRLDNVILVDDQKVVNTTLRFRDEFARHKILDLIGDLYLLGRPLHAHVTASKTGHSDNLALIKAVQSLL